MFLWPLLIILCDGFYYQNQFWKNADIKVTNSLIKLFLYTFQHPKKSCSDSSQGVVPTSKTAPTHLSAKPRPILLLSAMPRPLPPLRQNQWQVCPWLQLLERLCQRQAPSTHTVRRLSPKLWQIQIRGQLQPFPIPVMAKWRFSMTILAVMPRWRLSLPPLALLLSKPTSLPHRQRKKR